MNAWDYVKKISQRQPDVWTAEDWCDFYEGIDDAMNRIARRHGYTEPDPESRPQIINCEAPEGRSIVQIAISHRNIVALCNDGTLWQYSDSAEWMETKNVPQPPKDTIPGNIP